RQNAVGESGECRNAGARRDAGPGLPGKAVVVRYTDVAGVASTDDRSSGQDGDRPDADGRERRSGPGETGIGGAIESVVLGAAQDIAGGCRRKCAERYRADARSDSFP